jgi:hypothetical protein
MESINLHDNDIVVVLKEQISKCWRQDFLVHKGAIVKIKRAEPDSHDFIRVWKSIDRECKNDFTNMYAENIRIATSEEIKMFNEGVRNVEN